MATNTQFIVGMMNVAPGGYKATVDAYINDNGMTAAANVLIGQSGLNPQFAGTNLYDNAAFAAAVVARLMPGVSAAIAESLSTIVNNYMTANPTMSRGAVVVAIIDAVVAIPATDPVLGAASTAFASKVAAANAYTGTSTNLSELAVVIGVAAPTTGQSFTPIVESLNGTTGADVFTATAATWTTGDKVNGGDGTDTLNATISGAAPTQSATSMVSIEVLNLTATPQPATLDLTGVTGVKEINNASSANGATLTVSNVGAAVNSTLTGSQAATTISYTTAVTAATALTDASTVTLAGVAAGSSYTAAGVELVTVNSTASANVLSSLAVSSATKITIGGDKDLTLLGTVGGSALTAVDAAAFTGTALTFTAGAGVGGTAAAGVTVTAPTAATAVSNITTGANKDTVTLGAGNATLNTGAGNDTITTGAGANTVTPGTGNDTLTLGAGVDTVRYSEVGSTNSDTINGFSATDVLAFNIGQVTAAATTTAGATTLGAGTFGVVQTGATTPTFANVSGTGTAATVAFQSVAPATATANTIAQASNVVALNAFTDGTAAGVETALGATGTTGVTTTATGKFVLVTYSVGNIAQVWQYTGDADGDTNIDAAELSLVTTLNGVTQNSLAAANFASYLGTGSTTATQSNAGQTITLAGISNTVSSVSNTAGQYFTAADDVVNAPIGVLPTASAASTTQALTLIDGSATDTDTFNATVLGAGWDTANTTLVNIETVNLTMSVADANGFDMGAMMVGTNTVNFLGTASVGTGTAIANSGGKTFGFGTDYSGTVVIAGTTGTLNLAGNSATTAGTAPTFTTGGSTALTINVNGTSAVNLGVTTLVNTDTITVKGGSNLTIYSTAAAFGDAKMTATSTDYTGNLTLVPSGAGTMDFSDAASTVTGVRTVNISAGAAGANSITLAELNTGSVTVSSTATLASTLAVAQAGSGQSDTVTLSLGSSAASAGDITATSIENFNVSSGVAATSTLTLGAIALTDGAGSQKITITAAGNLAITTGKTFTADTVDVTGVAGTVGTAASPVTLANSAGVSFLGGNGATAVTGSGAADVITTGLGADTVSSGGGADLITTGAGADSVTGGAAAEIINLGTGKDTVTGAGGLDTIDLGVGDAAADTVITGNAAADADTIKGFVKGTDILDISAPLTAVTLTIGTQVAFDTTAKATTIAAITAAAGTDAEVYYIKNTLGHAQVLTLTEIETAIEQGTAATGQMTLLLDNGTDTLVYFDLAAQTDAGAGAGLILVATLVGITGSTGLATGDLISV